MSEFKAVIIEDDEDARMLLQHVVTGLGGTMIEAIDAAEGIAAVREHRPDLVLLDLALPGKDGWIVVEEMRADAQFQDTPIVVVTIKDQSEEQYRGQHVDWVQAYIEKPFEMSTLESSIRQALGL